MPNVFREQAQDRFTRSLAFLTKADMLLQDDLVNRSALADAVSAIKNMLQGYLLLRIAQTPETAVTQRWQEIAASNSMPDLLQACGEAGLDLRGLAVEIKALNRERNRRMHDDPGQRIEAQQAHHALDLARDVQRRIRAAVRSTAVAAGPEPPQPAQSTPARIAAVARAAVSGQLGHSAPRSIETAIQGAAGETQTAIAPDSVLADARADNAAALAEASPEIEVGAPPEDVEAVIPDETDGADDAGDAGDSRDTQLLAALTSGAPARPRNRVGRAIARALLVAALLLIGIIAGAGLMYPVATGHAPSWLAFATQFLPAASATPTATVIPTTVAPPTPTPSGPFVAGVLVVAPSCSAGDAAITLTNTDTPPVRWSIGSLGSPNSTAVMFALPGKGAASPSQSGILKGGASVTISVSGASGGADTLVVVASTGTVQLPAPTC